MRNELRVKAVQNIAVKHSVSLSLAYKTQCLMQTLETAFHQRMGGSFPLDDSTQTHGISVYGNCGSAQLKTN